MSEGDFRAQLALAAREQRDAAVADLKRKYAPKTGGAGRSARGAPRNASSASNRSFQQRLQIGILDRRIGARRLPRPQGDVGHQCQSSRDRRRARRRASVARAATSIAPSDNLEVVQKQRDDLQQQFDSRRAALERVLDSSFRAFAAQGTGQPAQVGYCRGRSRVGVGAVAQRRRWIPDTRVRDLTQEPACPHSTWYRSSTPTKSLMRSIRPTASCPSVSISRTRARALIYEEFLVTLHAQVDFQLKQMLEILKLRLSKRGIDLACLDIKDATTTLATATQEVVLRQGIDQDNGRKIARLLKDSKLKVQAAYRATKFASPANSATICRRRCSYCVTRSSRCRFSSTTFATSSPRAAHRSPRRVPRSRRRRSAQARQALIFVGNQSAIAHRSRLVNFFQAASHSAAVPTGATATIMSGSRAITASTSTAGPMSFKSSKTLRAPQ